MYRLKLLGGAAVESDGGPLAGRGVQRRRLAMLAYLALARGRAVPREKVAALLWPEADADRARHQVSDAVYRINQAVGAQAVVAAGEELRLDASALPSDVMEVLGAVADGAWERAIAVYGGPLLDGFFVPGAPEFERWAEAERGRLGREYVRALEALATEAERIGDHPRAVEYWRRAAVQEPYSSRIALRLMHALDAIGERASALKHARIHAELVRQDLGAPPDAEVAALAERWRVVEPVSVASTSAPSVPSVQEPSDKPPKDVDAIPASKSDPEPSHHADAPTIKATHAATAVATRATSHTSTALWRPLVAVALVLFLVVALIQFNRGRSETRPVSRATYRTVAVLPFANLSGDPANEYMSDGITDELINTFARVPGVRVASRTSAFSYKGTRLDVKEIGRRLGVEVVLEGSVRRAGDRLRVAAQLVGVEDGYPLWSQTFDRSASDVLAIQEEISRAIVGNMRGQLGGEAPALPRIEHPADDPESYDLYLKGRFAWHQRSEAGLRSAVEHFTASVTRAPRYARAWAGLADAYAVLGFYDYLPPRQAFPRARDAADRALALDSTYGAPLATRGYVSLYYDWSFELAEEEFRRSIAIDPTYSTAHQWYGNLLASRGRFAEAEREMRRAQELDPLSLIANAALGWVWIFQGRFDDAVAQCRRVLELNANFQLAWLWMGIAENGRGRPNEARDALQAAVRLSDGSTLTLAALARAHALGGRADSARAILATIEARAARNYVPSYDIAAAYLALGDRTAALARLEQALADRAHSMVFLHIDPQFVALRGNPRFGALVRGVEGR